MEMTTVVRSDTPVIELTRATGSVEFDPSEVRMQMDNAECYPVVVQESCREQSRRKTNRFLFFSPSSCKVRSFSIQGALPTSCGFVGIGIGSTSPSRCHLGGMSLDFIHRHWDSI